MNLTCLWAAAWKTMWGRYLRVICETFALSRISPIMTVRLSSGSDSPEFDVGMVKAIFAASKEDEEFRVEFRDLTAEFRPD